LSVRAAAAETHKDFLALDFDFPELVAAAAAELEAALGGCAGDRHQHAELSGKKMASSFATL
jgi:hypothetical protein